MPSIAIITPVLPALEKLLWWASIAGYASLLWRLFRTGLAGTYRWFAVFAGYHFTRSLVLAGLEPDTNLYAVLWLASAPLGWLVSVLVVLELYSLVLKDYKGIATLSRRVMLAALSIAVCLACLSLLPRIGREGEPYPVLALFANAERGVNSSLVLFIILICAFLVSFPVRVKRNAIVHAMVFSVYFLSSTMALLLRLITGQDATPLLNVSMSAVTLASLLAWCLFLTPAGEAGGAALRATRSGAQNELSRLSSINAILIARGAGEDSGKS